MFAAVALSVCESCKKRVAQAPDLTQQYEGIGAVNHPVKIKPEAQMYFNRGLAFVYGFDFDSAIGSFQRAAEIDPDSPMPYWGIALALGPNYNSSGSPQSLRKAQDYIRRAEDQIEKASPIERDYIHALALRYHDLSHTHESFEAYASAMRELRRAHEDDPDAGVLYADSLMNLHRWKLWDRAKAPGEYTVEIVDVLEAILRRWPEHIGANHLYIHAIEASPFPERGLQSAERLERLAPQAGHLVHMPAHIYFRTGDYAGAVKSSLVAVSTDQNFEKVTGHAHPVGYSMHNLYFLVFSASMDGEYEVALDAASALSKSSTHSDLMSAALPFVLARFGQWDKVLSLGSPDESSGATALIGHYFRGWALSKKHNLVNARQELTAMQEAYSELPRGAAFGVLVNSWESIYKIAQASLEARVAAAEGDWSTEIEAWNRAVEAEDRLEFDDLPDWYYPTRESLGAALLQHNQPLRAELVFREDLRHYPSNPRSLFGLSVALQKQGKADEEQWNRSLFEGRWRGKMPPDVGEF